MPCRRSLLTFILLYLLAALLAAVLGVVVATGHAEAAEAATLVSILVRDLDGRPIPDISFTVVDASGQSQPAVTDAQGRVELSIAGASIWVQGATGPGSASLEMDENTAEGGLRLPLDGQPLVLGFILDGTLLFRAPAVLDNPAFPEEQAPAPTALLALTPTATLSVATSADLPVRTPIPAAETDVAEEGFPIALALLLAVVTLSLLLLVVVWLRQVRRYRQGLERGRR